MAVPSAVDSISGAHMDTQFCDTLTHRLRIAKVAGLDLPQSGCDPRFRDFVPKRCDPLDERRVPILIPVVNELEHGSKCSIKATINRQFAPQEAPEASEFSVHLWELGTN